MVPLQRTSGSRFVGHKCPTWSLSRVMLVMLIFVLMVRPAQGATARQVDQSIARGKAFLYSKLNKDNWESGASHDPKGAPYAEAGGQWGGLTSLVVYSLLAAGEDQNDPKLAPAIKWLKQADIVGVYALGMRCQVWLLMHPTPETRALANADREKLNSAFNTATPRNRYLYGYLSTKKDANSVDHSVSQYGVLGMWACAQMGIEIPTKYWDDVEARWVHDQRDSGAWVYGEEPNGTDHPEAASITAAGVATLFITQDYVHQREGISCNGNIRNDHIDRGLKWMADHTSEWTKSYFWGDPGHWLAGYTLYGVERIGVASGLKYIGETDWYEFGADWCVRSQDHTGSWSGDNNVPDTSFILLFLARGRAPVLINKLQYESIASAGKPGPWNQRARDVANFVRWMARQTERDINWQVTNLNVPVAELHDAPFLYMSGNQAVNLPPEQTAKLKQYVQEGGMVLFNADCGADRASAFINSIVAMAKQLFPDYEFRDLPDKHPIFTNEQYVSTRWKTKVRLRGLSNGVRELMIIMPGDPAKSWQLQEIVGSGREESYQSTDDIVLYGTDKQNLLVKGDSALIKRNDAIHPGKAAKVARMKYAGNWDPEPLGWNRLTALMHNRCDVELEVEPIEFGKKFLKPYRIVHLTGTTAFTLTANDQKQLKQYAETGGTVVIDSAGGNSEFADSAESMLKEMYPDQLKDPLPPDNPVFKAGQPKTEIRYRPFAKTILGKTRSPQLQAIKVNGRNAIYYSRQDLSAGLVGQPVDGIVGYDPDSASAIMSGIIVRAIAEK